MAVNRGPRRLAMAVLVAGSLAILAACSKGAVVDLNTVPRDKIAALGIPILRVTMPDHGTDIFLSIREQKGNVTTWEGAGGLTFTFRDDILIETRGLGQDLMSASAPSAGRIASGAPSQRSYFFLGDDDVTQRRDYSCTQQTVGTPALTLFGRLHQTRQVTELCVRVQGKVTNHFWFEGRTVRQSQQFVSPTAGYATFARIVD